MIHKKIKLSGLKRNDDNPRLLKDSNWLKILNSVKESPAFMELNPIKVNEEMLILGGNQRYRACEFLKWETVPYQVFTKAMAIINNKSRIKNGLSEATYEEQCEEFIIKDNVSYGDWDYDMLANKWDSINLDHYGVDVWQPIEDESPDVMELSTEKEPLSESVNQLKWAGKSAPITGEEVSGLTNLLMEYAKSNGTPHGFVYYILEKTQN